MGRALQAAGTLFSHAAAGLLRLEDLRLAIREEWEQAALSEPSRYASWGLTDWESDLYLRFLKREDRILMVGCGTGRDLLALLEHGYRVDGLDAAPRSAATARERVAARGLRSEVHTGSIESFEIPGGFDAFVFSWFCYSYIPQSASRVATLRRLRPHLAAGGRVLISYIPAAPGVRQLPIRLARLVARASGSDWSPEPGDVLSLSSNGVSLSHFEHRFPPGTLEAEVAAADMRLVFHDAAPDGLAVLTP
jgi:SAM-dependent methyltransferase